jgi:hypothetical protein
MTMSKSNRASVPYLPKHDAGLRSANDEDDPYRAAAKPPEPTTCPQCHATFNEGRWSWDKPPDEILHLIENHAKTEKARRPLQRIMEIEDTREGMQVTTTDSHLARGIAEALHNAYKGDLKLRYSRDENLVRAVWKR